MEIIQNVFVPQSKEEKHAVIVYQVQVHKDDILTRDDQAAICPPVDGLTQGPFTVFFKIV